MLVHHDVSAGQGGAPTHRLDLQDEILQGDRVAAIGRALVLHREDAIEVTTCTAGESRAALTGGNLEAAVELGDIVLAQKTVGCLQGGDPIQPELLRQASLPGGEVAFRAPRACGEYAGII